jgi:hypothetical protein
MAPLQPQSDAEREVARQTLEEVVHKLEEALRLQQHAKQTTIDVVRRLTHV